MYLFLSTAFLKRIKVCFKKQPGVIFRILELTLWQADNKCYYVKS